MSTITLNGMPRPSAAVPFLAALFLVGLSALHAAPARADLRSADDKFLHGDYAGAIGEYKGIKGKDAGRAQLHLGRALLRVGDYTGASVAAVDAMKTGEKSITEDGVVLLAEAERATGHYAEARKQLEDVVKKFPKHLRARCQLGLIYRETGEKALADKTFGWFADAYQNDQYDDKNPESLLYLAIAARWLEQHKFASEILRDAVDGDPNLLEANVEWGWIFLSKYDAADAETSFDEVLKIDPHHPDAHAGLAVVVLRQDYDVTKALKHIGDALAVNPHHPAALAARARIELDNEQWDDAAKTVGIVLAVNPNDLEARSLLATARWLADDKAGFEAEKKKVLAANPRYAAFYDTVADYADKEHRYDEAIAFEEEALKLDPDDYDAQTQIGLELLRTGEETKGVDLLDKAFKADPFNVRAYNVLGLFDEKLPKEYVFASPTPDFKFRVPKDEKPMLERYVPRVMERAWADMVKRYGFTPKGPVTVMLFGDKDAYSVYTVGLPNLSALGVTFGRVITALSPSNGNLNWGLILWHELGHVFAIQLSHGRVPRWFTEGLSEYETLIARKEWRRHNEAELAAALYDGTLPSVAELNTKFIRAKDIGEVVVAYHMSSVTIQYLAETYGFPKIVEALKLYGAGKSTPQVLLAITGKDIPAFDKGFRAYLEKRLAVYKGSFQLELKRYTDLTAFETAQAAKPTDAEANADLALAYLVDGNLDKSAASAKTALAIDPKNKKALYAVAAAAVIGHDDKKAKPALESLIAAGGDGYDAREELANIATRADDLPEAEKQWALAKKLDPDKSAPYQTLALLYVKHGRDDDAIVQLEAYAYLEPMDFSAVHKLLGMHAAKQHWAKVREFGELALFLNPYDADLHVTIADADLALGKGDDAAFEYDSALLAEPPLRRPAVADVGLARAHLLRKDPAKARAAVKAALVLEPKNADALALEKQIH